LRRIRIAALLALAVGLMLPGGASAATKKLSAGPPISKPPPGAPKDADSNAFYRKLVTIHVGDKIRWTRGFHTITFPRKGQKPPPFISPDASGAKIAGQNDAAGAPFWFNGQTRLVLDPKGAFPVGGKSYNGKALTSSGAPLSNGPPKPYTLKFTKAGTYQYYCTIHPGMRGSVKVVKKGKRVPTAAADRKAVKKQVAKVIKRVIADDKFAGPAGNQVDAGHDTLSTTLLRFFPATKSIPVGGTLTLALSKNTTEIHTFAFGPADYLKTQADGFVTPDTSGGAGPPTLVFNPVIGFPSDPPPVLPPHTGAILGNGFFSTGVLDQDSKTPNPSSVPVTFSKAGTYSYICLIHPEMKGQIVVG
jgi:plastocyanin